MRSSGIQQCSETAISVTDWQKRTPASRSYCNQVLDPMYVVQSSTDLHCLERGTILHSNAWLWPLALASLRAAGDQPAAVVPGTVLPGEGAPNTGLLCPRQPPCRVASARRCCPQDVLPVSAQHGCPVIHGLGMLGVPSWDESSGDVLPLVADTLERGTIALLSPFSYFFIV